MMCWYFEITIMNCDTAEEETIERNFIMRSDMDYFTAWKSCVDAAKEVFDGKEKPFSWVIKSIVEVTRR